MAETKITSQQVNGIPDHICFFPWNFSAQAGWSIEINTARFLNGDYLCSSAGAGVYIEWKSYLPAGTYTFRLLTVTYLDQGKLDLTMDGGASLGMYDTYTAGVVQNATLDLTGIVVTAGSHTIRLTSTSNGGRVNERFMMLSCWRTA